MFHCAGRETGLGLSSYRSSCGGIPALIPAAVHSLGIGERVVALKSSSGAQTPGLDSLVMTARLPYGA